MEVTLAVDDIVGKTIDKLLLKLEEKTNIKTIQSIKRILDNSFGKEFNQIVKPTKESLQKYIRDYCNARAWQYPLLTEGDILTIINESKYKILIHFPKFEITNTKKEKRTIKDLYIQVIFDENGKFVGGLKGTRTTLSFPEARARYGHSHLPPININEMPFEKFCLGVGQITQALSLLRHEFDEINFTLFCLHLKSYVRWESIEGTPHIYMSSVQLGTSGLIALKAMIHPIYLKKIVDYAHKYIMDNFSEEEFKEHFQISLLERGVLVKPTEKIEEYLGTVIKTWPIRDIIGNSPPHSGFNWLLSTKDTAGNYYTIAATSERIVEWKKTPVLSFKGEDKFLVIEKEEEEIKTTKYVNPYITIELCRRLSCELSKAALETV